VIAKSYNRECDMWSIGVILFTLMCGYPPFWGDTEREIYGRVKRGHYAFEGPDWHIRSAAVKELVNSLLMMNASSRFVLLACPSGLFPYTIGFRCTGIPWTKH
jgi:calcium-dependent protein kinase